MKTAFTDTSPNLGKEKGTLIVKRVCSGKRTANHDYEGTVGSEKEVTS